MTARSRQWRLLGAEQVELVEIDTPEPAAGELVIRVLAATTCGTDLKVYRRGGHPRMLRPPTPFGHEVCGEVVATGSGSRGIVVGRRVVVANSAPCGECLQCRRQRENLCTDLVYLNGAFADHLLVPARFVATATHPIPDALTSEDAALAEPLACAVHCLELLEPTLDRWLRSGRAPRAVVLGGGPLGLLLIGLLARQGVAVTCADPHPQRLESARAFGAAEGLVVTDRSAPLAGAESFDATIDATGSAAGWRACVERVAPGGVAVFFGGTASGVELRVDAQRLHYEELSLLGVYHHRPASFERALRLLADGVLPHRLLISDRMPLEGLVEALERMADRRALKVALLPTTSRTAPER